MLFIFSVLFLISFFGLNFLLNKKANIPFALTPFLTIVCILITLYLLGIFGLLLGGAWLLYCIGFGSFFYYTYSKIKEKKITIKYLLQYSFYPLYFFAFLFFINLFLYKDIHITGFDELAHWGVFTKILTTYHDLIDQYTMINKADYPRISSLLHYYIISFLNKGVFNEGIVIFSQTLFFISASCFFIFHKKQKFIFYILIFVGFYLLFGIINYLSISHLYNDALLALFWGLSIVVYITNKKYLWIVGVILFCLPQIKETGILFCSFSLLIVAVNELFFSKELFQFKLKKIGILIGIVILSKLSWFLYIQYKGVEINSFKLGDTKLVLKQDDINKFEERYFKSLIYVGQYNYSLGYESDVKRMVFPSTYPNRIANILKKITGKESSLYHFLNNKMNNLIIGPAYFIILIIIYLFLIYYYKKSYLKRSVLPSEKKQYIYFSSSLCIIIISYNFIQRFLYLNTSFNTWEIRILSSFNRYLGTIVVGGLLILIYLISTIQKKNLLVFLILILFPFYKIRPEIKDKIKKFIVPHSSISLNTPTPNTDKNTFNNSLSTCQCISYEKLYSSLNIIDETTGENINNEIANMMDSIKKIDDKAIVYVINLEGTYEQKAFFTFHGFPLRILYAPFHITTEKRKTRNFINNHWGESILSAKEFKVFLKKSDYLIIRNDDCSFWEQYGEVIKETKLKGIFISRIP